MRRKHDSRKSSPPFEESAPAEATPDSNEPADAVADPLRTDVGERASGAADVVPLAPRTSESFNDLARRVAAAEPRRGSILQPPPAWEPDEVTLGFAMISDEAGTIRELAEPIVLATILIAVESARRRILNRLTAGADEEIVAVASLFWPLLILQGRTSPEVAIFDGTGVWKRTFRYTLLPPMETVQSLLTQSLNPQDELLRLRSLLPFFGYDPGAEVLTVEGFLPVDPPLLFDVLAHSEFRSDPQSPHSGFLPARHEVAWYHEVVGKMEHWLDRLDGDLATLASVRDGIRKIVETTLNRLDQEYLLLQAQARQGVDVAGTKAEEEITELHRVHRAALREQVERVRHAGAVVAHGVTSAATADTLGLRAAHRRNDTEVHTARKRGAESQIRQAHRQVAEARRAMEQIHAEERANLERVVAKIAEVELQYARALAERELFRDDFRSTGEDLVQAIDGQIAARSAQRNLLAGYFLPLPSLRTVRVVWFPLWAATLRGPRGVRQLVFPPMQVRSGKGIRARLKELFGGVVLPLEPRTAQFDRVLRTTMEESLASDPWLSTATQELTRASDVLADPDVLQRFQTGLRELGRAGWVSAKQQQEFLRAYVERSQRMAVASPTTPRPVPPQAGAEHPAKS